MSINQYSSDIPETPWWMTRQQSSLMEPLNASSCGPPIIQSPWPTQAQQQQQQQQQQPCVMNRGKFNLNNQDEEIEEEEELEEEDENGRLCEEEEEEKEGMFEKALTPSDVGKLNRLVIPKHQAEKYFPLSDSENNNKGVLLSFEDESSKCWRFRYSYWNSSQSYVLTKGWSRYVKDKRLLAGDVVSFFRLPSLPHRFFISFTRRHTSNKTTVAWTTTTPFYSAHPYPTHQPFPFPPPGRGSQSERQIGGNSSNKVLRLFGVNMELECQTDQPDESGSEFPTTHVMSSSTHHQFYHYHHHLLHPSNYAHNPIIPPPRHHMDVNQMGNRPG